MYKHPKNNVKYFCHGKSFNTISTHFNIYLLLLILLVMTTLKLYIYTQQSQHIHSKSTKQTITKCYMKTIQGQIKSLKYVYFSILVILGLPMQINFNMKIHSLFSLLNVWYHKKNVQIYKSPRCATEDQFHSMSHIPILILIIGCLLP